MNVSDKVVRRLILGKDALSESRSLTFSSSSEFNLMKGLWLADFSLEISTPAFCDHLNITSSIIIPKGQKPGFTPYLDSYLTAIKDYFVASLSDISEQQTVTYLTDRMSAIHKKRNQVQHEGISFDAQSVRTWVSQVGDYLNDISTKCLNKDFDSVTIASMIKDKEARDYFENAVDNLRNGNFHNAAVAAKSGYLSTIANLLHIDFSKDEQGRELRRNRQALDLQILVLEDASSAHNRHPMPDKNLIKAFERLVEYLYPMQFGISLEKSTKFLSLSPQLHRAAGSKVYWEAGNPKHYTKQDAQFLVDAGIDIAYAIEQYFL